MAPSEAIPEPVPVPRTLAGGALMGLANLVPGISGGTMILAIGLYDRFVGAVADVTRLRLRRGSLLFLAVLLLGLGGAVVAFSGVAVNLVTHYRWVMYSLFIGLTLGGAPELVAKAQLRAQGSGQAWLAFILGMATMAGLTFALIGTHLPSTPAVLLPVGALAASSMILPGISGSYILLILGMYDTVIGSLSLGAMREDLAACLGVVLPVVIGAVVGIGLLSNLLKWVLAKHTRVSHGMLLGLLCGSVFGLFPFQEPVYPELARKDWRKATVEVLAGVPAAQVIEQRGLDLNVADLRAMGERHQGKTSGQLKLLGSQLAPYSPAPSRVANALGLLLVGVGLTRLLSRGQPTPQQSSKSHD